jgi:hypothetical protein
MIGKKLTISLGEFSPVPVDKYTVEIADVELKMVPKYKAEGDEEILNYKFAILDDKPMMAVNEDGDEEEVSTRGRFLWKRCRLALGEKAWLRKLADAAYGHKLTKEELKMFDADDLVGRQLTVLVEHVEKDDKVFVNITSFNKVGKELESLGSEGTTERVVEKASSPAVAPKVEETADDFTAAVDAEKAKVEEVEEEDDPEVLELQLKLAKAKAAKAKKAAGK